MVRFRETHLQCVHRFEHDVRNDEPRILFFVCGNDIPWRMAGAGGAEAILIRLHVVRPEFPFFDVGGVELPVLFRLFDALQKALSLLLFRQMQEEFEYPSGVRRLV